MIVPDLNLLLYAFDASSPYHPRAKAWLERLAADQEEVGLALVVCLGFVRITTSRTYKSPLSRDVAIQAIESLLALPNFRPLEPGPRHWQVLAELLRDAPSSSNLITDAHLAALAKENGAEMHTNDRGFEHFKGVRLYNPLLD
jgi:toxin-antitoxin system PIN domain toxin